MTQIGSSGELKDTQGVRVLLDTNLWSSLDDGSLPRLETLVRELDLQVQVLPSTLLEIVEIPHEDVRKRIVSGLAKGSRRTRVRTEADLFAEEVVALISRTRPEWLLQIPNHARVASLRTFWLKKVWRQALKDSSAMHEYQRGQLPMRKQVVQRQKHNRTELLRTKFKLDDLTQLAGQDEDFGPGKASPRGDLPGWDGSRRDLWRLNLAQLAWHQLAVVGPRAGITGEDRTMTDWIEPWVDLGKLRSNPKSFVQMWLEEAHIADVPRNWLNWAVDVVQWTGRVGSGNPADAQHSSYLIDCDLFLTADSRFVDILERVRADAPFPFAATVLVDGDRAKSTADRIEHALSINAQENGI
ncbi:hypothetical protein [Paenarthrobacter sp. PH39-S1]|uniref:hypothetical protein n=1 Tax=Paenarthrobacter sp. PH39-S1 TaxID=3046204 RepID=UPI0024B95A94|nr:hypothetical protein [Paenarthrobacter sp. PH39-S1]MDJ0356048.1 hypothetical protein [Paenarthrobacter sp. PH39-S1]